MVTKKNWTSYTKRRASEARLPDFQVVLNTTVYSLNVTVYNEILSKHNTYYTAPRKYKMHGHEILIQNYYLKSFIMGKKSTLQCGPQLA